MKIDPLVLFVAATILPGLLTAWIVGFVVRWFAPRMGLVDHPGDRKVHKAATPLGGGLAIWLGVLTPFAMGTFLIWRIKSQGGAGQGVPWLARLPLELSRHIDGAWETSDSLWIILGAATVMMLVGLADDAWNLGWIARLAVQFGVAAFCVGWQGWRATAFINVEIIAGLLSVLWIVAMINSFNMLDNMDGLSGGVAVIAGLILAGVMLLTRDPESGDRQYFVAGLLLVVVGGVLGFLIHNRPPARIFMGDAGSYFIGFCIAVATLLATYTGYHSDRQMAVLAPIFVMAVPMYDMLTVLWIRIRERRSPFKADKSHFSHRLVDLGLSKGQAVLTIYLLTGTCGLGALLLHRVDVVGALIILLMILCILGLIAILETTALRKIKRERQANGER